MSRIHRMTDTRWGLTLELEARALSVFAFRCSDRHVRVDRIGWWTSDVNGYMAVLFGWALCVGWIRRPEAEE